MLHSRSAYSLCRSYYPYHTIYPHVITYASDVSYAQAYHYIVIGTYAYTLPNFTAVFVIYAHAFTSLRGYGHYYRYIMRCSIDVRMHRPSTLVCTRLRGAHTFIQIVYDHRVVLRVVTGRTRSRVRFRMYEYVGGRDAWLTARTTAIRGRSFYSLCLSYPRRFRSVSTRLWLQVIRFVSDQSPPSGSSALFGYNAPVQFVLADGDRTLTCTKSTV